MSLTKPKWITYQGQVLRFFGFFIEPVLHSPVETHRVRKVEVLYYLNDDSLQVVEPRDDANSGLMQGILVQRHKTQSELLSQTLHVGRDIRVFGRQYALVDADAFTRGFFRNEFNVELLPSQPYPVNPRDEYLKLKNKPSGLTRCDPESPSRYVETLLGRASSSKKLQQFLEHNCRVLRFFCIWEFEGVHHRCRLHYFLEDNTLEIVEEYVQNSGMLPCTTFLKRSMLPKRIMTGLQFSPITAEECCMPTDLRIGHTLSVHGRSFLLYDADVFTKTWLKEHLDCSDEDLKPLDVLESPAPPPPRILPPHNGIGDPKDSLQNCIKLVPIAPKKDPYKLIRFQDTALRFSAKLSSSQRALTSAEAQRRFIVSFYLASDECAVYEQPHLVAGFPGGKTLEKKRVPKVGQPDCWYEQHDFYTGATVNLHGRHLELLEPDEFTERYIALHQVTGQDLASLN